MIYPYAVKYNGVYYPPNTEIVENPVENVETAPATVENPVENAEKPKTRGKRGAAK